MNTKSKVAVTALVVSLLGAIGYYVQSQRIAELQRQLAEIDPASMNLLAQSAAQSVTQLVDSRLGSHVAHSTSQMSSPPVESQLNDPMHPTLEIRQKEADDKRAVAEKQIANFQKQIDQLPANADPDRVVLLKRVIETMCTNLPQDIAGALAGPLDLGEIQFTNQAPVTLQVGNDATVLLTPTVNPDGSVRVKMVERMFNPDGSPIRTQPVMDDPDFVAGTVSTLSFDVHLGVANFIPTSELHRKVIFTPLLTKSPLPLKAPDEANAVP